MIVDMPVVVGVSHGTSHPDQAAGDSNFQIQGIPCRNGGTQRIIPNPGRATKTPGGGEGSGQWTTLSCEEGAVGDGTDPL